MRREAIVGIALVFALARGASTQEPAVDPDAKALFFESESGRHFVGGGTARSSGASPSSVPADDSRRHPSGLKYRVHLVSERGRQGQEVEPQRTFRSGEKVQLVIQSKGDGHLFVLALGTGGTAGLIFPDPAQGLGENRVRAGEDVVLPGPQHYFEFDATPGTERLIVVLARSMNELERFRLAPTMERREVDALVAEVRQATGAKDLLVRAWPGDAADADRASYVVNVNGGVILETIDLEHR